MTDQQVQHTITLRWSDDVYRFMNNPSLWGWGEILDVEGPVEVTYYDRKVLWAPEPGERVKDYAGNTGTVLKPSEKAGSDDDSRVRWDRSGNIHINSNIDLEPIEEPGRCV